MSVGRQIVGGLMLVATILVGCGFLAGTWLFASAACSAYPRGLGYLLSWALAGAVVLLAAVVMAVAAGRPAGVERLLCPEARRGMLVAGMLALIISATALILDSDRLGWALASLAVAVAVFVAYVVLLRWEPSRRVDAGLRRIMIALLLGVPMLILLGAAVSGLEDRWAKDSLWDAMPSLFRPASQFIVCEGFVNEECADKASAESGVPAGWLTFGTDIGSEFLAAYRWGVLQEFSHAGRRVSLQSWKRPVGCAAGACGFGEGKSVVAFGDAKEFGFGYVEVRWSRCGFFYEMRIYSRTPIGEDKAPFVRLANQVRYGAASTPCPAPS